MNTLLILQLFVCFVQIGILILTYDYLKQSNDRDEATTKKLRQLNDEFFEWAEKSKDLPGDEWKGK